MSFENATGNALGFLAWLAGMAQHYSWYVVYNRGIFVIVSAIVGLMVLNVRRYYPDERQRKHPDELTAWDRLHDRYPALDRVPVCLSWRPLRSIAGAIAGLSISSGLVTGSILLHAADPYWLPPGSEKASHLAAPHISAPAVSAPGNVPLVGGALKALAGAITGSLQHAVDGTNTALSGITNAGNAVVDMGIRIHAATIAGQVAFEFGVLWLLSTVLLAMIIALALAVFIARTAHKLVEYGHKLWVHAMDIARLKRENREQQQTIVYMAELLRTHHIWPANQPLPQLLPAEPDDGMEQPGWSDEEPEPPWTGQGYGQTGPQPGFGGLDWRR